MRNLGTGLLLLVTAVVTAIVTSIFWIAMYNLGRNAPPQAGSQPPPVKQAPALVVGPSGLAIPVAGVGAEELQDTYTQSRADGARAHNAIDIMAPRGTPVVAAAPGTVEKLFFSQGGGGITAYVRSPDQLWIYYYAHLDSYTPGLREGQRLRQGDPIGTVGTSGNANPAGPHLHFAVHRMAPGEDWHEGRAVNPFPLLAGPRPAR